MSMEFEDLSSFCTVVASYATPHNFLGRPAAGYKAQKALLLKPAAEALREVARVVANNGYDLVIYDAYRPKQAVKDFLNWSTAPLPHSTQEKKFFYPTLARHKLFEKGYIASQSAHSRGFTADLTLMKKGEVLRPDSPVQSHVMDAEGTNITILNDGSLDMGGHFDLLHPLSHQDASGISEEARHNRDYLRKAMEAQGFIGYKKEWWHFTHKSEPQDAPAFEFDIA